MDKAIQKYIDMGFEPDFAAYFANGQRILVSVVANPDYTIMLEYDNGERRSYDVSKLIKQGTVFAPLRDIALFQRVYVDDTHNIAWDIDSRAGDNEVQPNKIDISADTCYVRGQVI